MKHKPNFEEIPIEKLMQILRLTHSIKTTAKVLTNKDEITIKDIKINNTNISKNDR